MIARGEMARRESVMERRESDDEEGEEGEC